jgi:hypothetical protein
MLDQRRLQVAFEMIRLAETLTIIARTFTP